MRKQIYVFLVLMVLAGSGTTYAANKVVVVPLNSADRSSGTTTIFMPVGSLVLGGNAYIYSNTHLYLTSTGLSSISSSIIVPDYKPDTEIYADLLIYNPSANGACQADIRKNFCRRFIVGSAADLFCGLGYTTSFPSFSAGDRTISHQYRFEYGLNPGDAITFGWFRAGDDSSDTCGSVEVVGVKVRYEKP